MLQSIGNFLHQHDIPGNTRTVVGNLDANVEHLAHQDLGVEDLGDFQFGLGADSANAGLRCKCDACDASDFPFRFRDQFHDDGLFRACSHFTQGPGEVACLVGSGVGLSPRKSRSTGDFVNDGDVVRGGVPDVANDQ